MNISYKIVDIAVDKFKKSTGFDVILNYFHQNNQQDAILKVKNDDYSLEFKVDIKLFLNKSRLGLLVQKMKITNNNQLLVTKYVNPHLMDTLQKNNINFIDAAGNAFIRVHPLFIKIKGEKLNKSIPIKTEKESFNSATLKVIFVLLCFTEKTNLTIRSIQKYSGSSLGSVQNTMKKLQEQGFLIMDDLKKYKLVNKKELLEKWVILYPEYLKSKITIGRYKSIGSNELLLNGFDAYWGGETAAAKITNYLTPFISTIYLNDKQGEFILRNKLNQDSNGNIILIKKFWQFENSNFTDLTHPILIYADLLATGDPRNIETAKLIYEKYIVQYIEEN